MALAQQLFSESWQMRAASRRNGGIETLGKNSEAARRNPRDAEGSAVFMTTSEVRRKPFYTSLSFQVLVGIAIAIVLGYLNPAKAIAMKPLGDGFIRLLTMIITLVIFCTVVTGIAGMEDMKKVGRVGGKALLYFEAVSTLALLIGLVVGNVVRPGAGFNINPATLDAKAVADYAGQAK